MLTQTHTHIIQSAFSPEKEEEIERQLEFSNGYLRQYAYFEEHYSGEQALSTYAKGLCYKTGDEIKIPNLTNVSVRLHDERLDLHTWTVLQFERTLCSTTATLERKCMVRSPKGHTLRIESKRSLSMKHPECIQIDYRVESVDYDGPISILSLIGDGQRSETEWYPLYLQVTQDIEYIWWQSRQTELEICAAATNEVYKNGTHPSTHPILIEKPKVLGYAVTETIHPGEWLVAKKRVVLLDSQRHAPEELVKKALQLVKE